MCNVCAKSITCVYLVIRPRSAELELNVLCAVVILVNIKKLARYSNINTLLNMVIVYLKKMNTLRINNYSVYR